VGSQRQALTAAAVQGLLLTALATDRDRHIDLYGAVIARFRAQPHLLTAYPFWDRTMTSPLPLRERS